MSETPCPFCGQIHGTACNTTIPANQADQIAAVVATPAVVQHAQQYGHDEAMEDLDSIEACEEVWECPDGCCTYFIPRHNDECIRIAAYIERLEAERDALLAERTLVDIVFDGPPSHESGKFVEVEDMSGASVRVGEWIDRGNGYWALRIPTTTPRG